MDVLTVHQGQATCVVLTGVGACGKVCENLLLQTAFVNTVYTSFVTCWDNGLLVFFRSGSFTVEYRFRVYKKWG